MSFIKYNDITCMKWQVYETYLGIGKKDRKNNIYIGTVFPHQTFL